MEDERPAKGPKIVPVKNKMPAPIQITAEQLLREAKEKQLEYVAPPPRQKISDPEELAEYRMKKRKEMEDAIRKNRLKMVNWVKYAHWEESQQEIQRARSIWERALDVDYRNIAIWLKYAEMEMRYKQINHARNIWDRAIAILPRANQFWYKYTYMEEMLSNIAGCRQIFERWMEWQPDEQAWNTYIKFELRYNELERARMIYERFVVTHPEPRNWIRYAKFEEQNNYIKSARRIYERAIEFFGEEHLSERLLLEFAKFEEHQKEHDRCRMVYKYALEHLPKSSCEDIFKAYTIHEKKYGDRTGIEDVITSKRKFQYEEELKENSMDYDTWFDYLRLLESEGDVAVIREAYEKAIAQIPPIQEKRYWRRYIYIWINYALFEELEAENIELTRGVYKNCLNLIPHKKFTFAKIWLYYAQFEIRQKELASVRKILGTAIGMCPKDKLFRGYIDLEIQLREFDNCRRLYEKFLEFGPDNCTTWIKFAELESILGDTDRARAIYELAIEQPRLDMPELLWKAFIDFEIEQQEYDHARKLYSKLLKKTQHVKVWLSLAQFEAVIDESDSIDRARDVFEQAYKTLRTANDKEERLMLVENWLDFEKERGTKESVARVEKCLPKRIKQRRKILSEDGTDSGKWEEYMQLVFPDDEAVQPHLKLLSMAKRWKKGQDDVSTSTNVNTDNDMSTAKTTTETEDDNVPLPESRIDDEEMNDES
ncbi:unnamed protein product [Rotaria sordida]|uniref:Pre-mRNA-splicing factor Syf1/CRNKL1-like C-terminal HAT-repeats domain-containing protein n=1 Tax=Rotaria sordida TaxID=392033 RepID=A0A818U113_9BILA|nr:unnamed protein product [Rotaria sordida]CAF3686456.1 unnamed protein product [Rotaria sordida]